MLLISGTYCSQAAAKAAASKAAAAACEEAGHQAGRIRALEAELARRRAAEDALARQLQVRHRQSRVAGLFMVVTFCRVNKGMTSQLQVRHRQSRVAGFLMVVTCFRLRKECEWFARASISAECFPFATSKVTLMPLSGRGACS